VICLKVYKLSNKEKSKPDFEYYFHNEQEMKEFVDYKIVYNVWGKRAGFYTMNLLNDFEKSTITEIIEKPDEHPNWQYGKIPDQYFMEISEVRYV
jgi:hypothetical protein